MNEIIELNVNEAVCALKALYIADYEGSSDSEDLVLMRKLEEFVAENGREEMLRGY